MTNFILNGDFSSGFDYWNNGVGGGLAYTLDAGRAKASSEDSGTEKYYAIRQPFSINNEVVAATITVWCKWHAVNGPQEDGYNRFIVELLKPNMSSVTLLDVTKTAVSGEGYLLNGYDIASEFDQYGNYEIWLLIKTKSATEYLPPLIFYPSYGWYDNINVNVAVKKYKTVIEPIGGAESYFTGEGYTRTTADELQLSETEVHHVKKFISENLNLIENYLAVGKVAITSKETLSLLETYLKKLRLSEAEALKFIETHEILSGLKRQELEFLYLGEDYSFLSKLLVSEIAQIVESYATHKIKPTSQSELMRVSEIFSAKRIQGNLETFYTAGTPTQWDTVTPTVTPWIKTKIIN